MACPVRKVFLMETPLSGCVFGVGRDVASISLCPLSTAMPGTTGAGEGFGGALDPDPGDPAPSSTWKEWV